MATSSWSPNQPGAGFASREERIEAALWTFREQFDFERVLTKDEEEAILVFGAFGV
ncbi:MAG TPA: hypothetical protein VL127_16930 [Bryobacteraceae bacterium]|nr:hypothetical protein [Bryobacteraceae bacterium]